MKKNIESQAKNEGFGWLKHEILYFVHCLFFFWQVLRARAVLSMGKLAGASFVCCRCSKVVVHLKGSPHESLIVKNIKDIVSKT